MSPRSDELQSGAMLERETETIIRLLTGQTIGSAHSLALKDALATAMPRSIKLYLHCEVARLMQEDLQSTHHFSKLPFTAPVVHGLTRGYTRALALEYILTREEFVTMLENGVHFVENYLCRPQWTLEHFVFEKSQRVTLAELQRKFEYVCEYLYFGTLVGRYLQQKGWQEIGTDEFRSLIAKIDDRIIRQHTAAELAQLTRPIYEFLLLQPDVRNKPISIKALTVFFEDKGMKPLMEYVEKVCHIRSTDQLTIEQLAAIIADSSPGYSETARSPGGPAALASRPGEKETEHASHPAAIPGETTHAAEPVPEPPRETAAPGGDKRNIALSLTYSGMTGTSQPPPLPSELHDLHKAIAQEQRIRFIRTIFQEDESYFNVVVETLNDMRTWKDASLYLRTFFHTSGIDPGLPEALEFSDIVQLRYLSQSSS